jgi:hypothetical protein
MKFLKKLSCAAAVALSFAGAAHAGPVLNDWKFNPLGTGVSNASNVHEYLDVVGNAFIQLTTTGANSFSFKETAVFYVPGIDGTPFDSELYPNGNANITATFTAFGTGSFNGAFTFAGGTINLYQDNAANYGSTAGFYGANDGKLIASFDVLNGGGGKVDALGNPIGNGEVTVFAKADAGDLASGYFFRGNGNDLSMEKILSFAFTNANPVSVPSGRLVSEVACQMAGAAPVGTNCATGAGYSNQPGQYFFVGNNGQFKLAEVPEPGSLALFGIAMLGAGVTLRKRNTKA